MQKVSLEVMDIDTLTISTVFHLNMLECLNIKKKKGNKKKKTPNPKPPNCPKLSVKENALSLSKKVAKLFNSHRPTDNHIYALSQ